MSVDVLNETEWIIDPKMFSDLAVWTMERMQVSTQSDLTIIFNEPEPMADLHMKWMNLKGPTDVMSFPMDELRPGADGQTPEGVLGDIVLCPYVAKQQADAAGHTLLNEMCMLTIHGILHLLGYDHTTHAEEAAMFAVQRELFLLFFSLRPGTVSEIRLPDGSPDLLAEYEKNHRGEA
ncbi:MAG: rRNA maturation RNase YbeY [Bifidobacteriaceae bacterium]|nr:rRNA maturation RNase YbeY [Bifidobacteriaceae bacterium]